MMTEKNSGLSKFRIEVATESDLPVLLRFIKGLAEYENLLDEVVASEEQLRLTLFGGNRVAEVLLAYYSDEPSGIAIYFHSFSTFLGKPGIYLEDLYVMPEKRGKGIGKALLIHLARIAVERDCGRFEWSVLDWNEPAIRFYKGLGAISLDDWTVHRLTGDALAILAKAEVEVQ